MILNLSPKVVSRRGITLLELTVAIVFMLALTAILFIGSRAWKRGSDRTLCVLTQRDMQMAARAYQNLYGYDYGGHHSAENGSQDIALHLFEKGYIEGKLHAQASGLAPCPAGGHYNCPQPDIFPAPGKLFMKCSLSTAEDHEPASHANW